MDGRRTLEFERLDQVMPEVDRLLRGHATSGTWTLGQILDHLATSVRLTLDFEPPALAEGEAVDPRQDRIFEVRRRRFFDAGRFPEGATPPLPDLFPSPETDAQTSSESLREALDRFEQFDGTFPDTRCSDP